jgi:GTP cyclohydrolase IA
MNKIKLSNAEIFDLARDAYITILDAINNGLLPPTVKIFPIPRGGIPAAYAIIAYGTAGILSIVERPADADIFIDDIIDSGETMRMYCDLFPGKPFFALVDKTDPARPFGSGWIVFPWEDDGNKSEGIEANITRLLQYIGEDPKRGGLIDTPRRVAKAWQHWAGGYGANIKGILKTFEDGADSCDEMIVVKGIPFYTHCEHHMAPFFGTVTVAYVPNGRIVGLSKLSRVVDAFARRLQVQERLTNQIADALQEHLEPLGVGVVVTARHLCMESRGIQQQGSETITSALRGVMRTSGSARSEFLALATK